MRLPAPKETHGGNMEIQAVLLVRSKARPPPAAVQNNRAAIDFLLFLSRFHDQGGNTRETILLPPCFAVFSTTIGTMIQPQQIPFADLTRSLQATIDIWLTTELE